ncbi:MAG TPA: ABC transporter permease [Gemmatimonadaceae bacterium]|jgi:predicted permease|nr:ABC transporter permease [Gemmatimonadaceae bacterium]
MTQRPAPGWRRLFRLPLRSRRALERAVDDELAFHLRMRAESLERSGVDAPNAGMRALEQFGNRDRIRDECVEIDQHFAREARMREWLESFVSDLRYALRSLRTRPVFTTVSVLTLALGIGATSAMFSLVDGILLRPLPYPEPNRLVRFAQSYPEKGLDTWSLSPENVAMYRDRVRDFESFAAYHQREFTLANGSHPERVTGALVTADFFKVLGVAPLMGRDFTRAEDTPHDNTVAILSYGYWQARFAGDRSIVGTTLDVDGAPVTVIGIMPSRLDYPSPDISMYMPLGLDPSQRFGWFLRGIARLRPGATVAGARRDATAVMQEWARGQPGLVAAGVDPSATRMTALVTPLRDAITGDVARPLAVLQAAVIVLLLIAIANVAALVSSRAAARTRERAMRTALGATRGRVIRQLLTESVALACLGGIVGVALAWIVVRLFTHSPAVSLPRIGEVGVSWRVVSFAFAASIVSGVFFGLAPALGLRTSRIGASLVGQRESARLPARQLNNLLIVVQFALSFLLLVSAGLVLKSFRQLLHTDLGFEPAGVTVIGLPLPHTKLMTPGWSQRFADDALRDVRAIPGVSDAAVTFPMPFSGGVNTDGYLVAGHAPPASAGSETQAVQVCVSPGFFRILKTPVLYGRDFTDADRAGSLPVVIVDDELAHRYWHGVDALGKLIRTTGDTTWMTIVGVTGSVRDQDAASPPRPHMYFPYAQTGGSNPTLAIRTSGAPAATIGSVRAALSRLEPELPLDDVQPLTTWVSRALDDRRITELLLAGFATLAALLTGVGIYGVMSLYVANRQREFGIRLAVGAEPVRLLRAVLREGLGLALAGVAIGIVGGFATTRWIRSLLYEVKPNDPVVFTLLGLALLAIAAASCYLPARRAAKSDPLSALRAD